MIKVLAYIVIWFGVAFNFFGAVGLIRFPDLYNRLQASTKCVTLGTSGILFGLFMLNGFTATGIKCLVCTAFILLTSPVAAHAIARGSYVSGLKLWKGSVTDKLGEDTKGKPQIEDE
jgi:multicomponent Na+:H+ antiporter subunit G